MSGETKQNGYSLTISEDGEVAYLRLPGFPKDPNHAQGCVATTVRLLDAYPNHVGLDIYLDYNSQGEIIGIEFT